MLIQPQFETYRYTGEIDCLKSQSMVECRLPGSEIGSVLAVRATAVPTECVCADGEVRYAGKVLLSIVYEDGNRKICRAERGVEFFHKADGSTVTPACFAKTAYSIDNITHRREGSGLYITVVVGAHVNVYGGKQMEYLTGGENVIVNADACKICRTVCVSGETETEDEFESDYVGDVLLHSEKAVVTHVGVSAGEVIIEGDLSLNVCVLRSDEGVCSYERILPFSMKLPCEEAFGQTRVSARVCVKSAQLSVSADEERGKSKMLFSYVLSTDCFLTATEEITVAKDAFSPLAEVAIKKAKGEGMYLTKTVKYTERISGEAVLSPETDGEYALEAGLLPRAVVECKKTERGVEAEGVILAEVLLRSADGGRKSASLSLPFVFPVDCEGDVFETDSIVCGLNVRRKSSGETEAEATIRLCVRAYERMEWEYIDGITEGEAHVESDCAVSIFVPRAGESLWEVAKRLSQDPEELKKSNPELDFPVKEGERIFVYRQIK
ncbi:MAG: hypothetical protein E7368_00440 [Clostridiales bacterium]|nr:hypothetical protein [Clostridiales bacterium]